MAASVYDQVPLDRNKEEIRLLVIEFGEMADPLACTLQKASFADGKPSFAAISYVWGDAKDVVPVVINGDERRITRSLANILRQLRAPPGRVAPDGRMRIWADGICINQSDDVEKSHQVGLMGKIYSECEMTLVFLGYPSSVDSNGRPALPAGTMLSGIDLSSPIMVQQVMRYLTYVDSDPGPPEDIDFFLEVACFLVLSEVTEDCAKLPPFCWGENLTEARSAYVAGFELVVKFIGGHAWFQRVWTLQEIALGPPDGRFILGRYCIHGKTLLAAAETAGRLATAAQFERYLDIYDHLRLLYMNLLGLLKTRMTYRSGNSTGAGMFDYSMGSQLNELMGIVLTNAYRDSSHDLDRIYGFLGLVRSWDASEPILPEYERSTAELYTQVTEASILGRQSLAPLCLNSRKGSCKSLPTWVVDWTAFRPCVSKPWIAGSSHLTALRSLRFRTSHTWRKKIQVIDSTYLRVHAMNIATVCYMSSTLDGDTSLGALLPDFARAYKTAGHSVKTYVDGTSWIEALLRTLYFDSVQTLHAIRHCEDSELQEEIGFWTQILGEVLEVETPEPEGRRLDLALLRSFQLSIGGRFFFTHEGFMGFVVSEDVQVGDSVMILANAPTPFVMRSDGNHVLEDGKASRKVFGLVSACYVHGVMNGDWIERVVSESGSGEEGVEKAMEGVSEVLFLR